MGGHNHYCSYRHDGGAYLGAATSTHGVLVYGENYPALKKQIKKTPTTILVEQEHEYKVVLDDIRRGDFGGGTIAVFDRSNNPDEILPRIDDKINKTHVLYNIPENEFEALAVHGGSNIQSGVSLEKLNTFLPKLREVAEAYRKLGAIKIEKNARKSASEWLLSYIDSLDRSDVVILASHIVMIETLSTDGSGLILPYPDGLLPLVDRSVFKLSSIKGRVKPITWAVGCNTWDLMAEEKILTNPMLTISSRITYPESLLISRSLLGASANTVRSQFETLQQTRFILRDGDFTTNPQLPNPDTTEGQPHLPVERPRQRLQLIVDNTLGNNLIVDAKMVV